MIIFIAHRYLEATHSYNRFQNTTPPQTRSTQLKEHRELEQQTSQGKFYLQDKGTTKITLDRLEHVHQELQHAFERWEILDSSA